MLEKISNISGLQLRLVKQLPIKQASGYLLHYIFEDAKSQEKYICAVAVSEYQKFAMKRSLDMIYRCKETFGDLYEFNFPICAGELDEGRYHFVLYRFFSSLQRISLDATEPIEIINKVYTEKAIEYIVDKEFVELIEKVLLGSFPEEARQNIKETEEYLNYINLLRKYDKVLCIPTHLDYAPPNILKTGDELYLMDFEQGAELLPIGYDLYHYYKFLKEENIHEVPYYELNDALWKVLHISHVRRGTIKYVPVIELIKREEKMCVFKVNECGEKSEIKMIKEKKIFKLDMKDIDITPYAFLLLVQSFFDEFNIANRLYVCNCMWWIEGMHNENANNIVFEGIVRKGNSDILSSLKKRVKKIVQLYN